LERFSNRRAMPPARGGKLQPAKGFVLWGASKDKKTTLHFEASAARTEKVNGKKDKLQRPRNRGGKKKTWVPYWEGGVSSEKVSSLQLFVKNFCKRKRI